MFVNATHLEKHEDRQGLHSHGLDRVNPRWTREQIVGKHRIVIERTGLVQADTCHVALNAHRSFS